MIKEVYAQCNLPYLQKLFETYIKINDEQEIIYIGGRIIQSEDDQVDKAACVQIFDTFYQIVSKKRKICREIQQIEAIEEKNGKEQNLEAIKEYKTKVFSDIALVLNKLVNDIKKGIRNNENRNKELEAFLQFNLADYKRYLCEVTLDPTMKEELIEETEQCYLKYFQMLEEANVCNVSPASISGHYHYAIFMFEIQNKKTHAIKYLKDQRFEYISRLDTMFKNFIESYELLDIITTTLTNWVILTNYKDVEFN